MLRVGWDRCPYCQRSDLRVSQPKSIWEEIAILLLLRPVRCLDCMRRSCRFLFIATEIVDSPTPARKPVEQTGSRDADTKRSA